MRSLCVNRRHKKAAIRLLFLCLSSGTAASDIAELHVKLPTTTTFGYDFFDDNSRNTTLWGTTDLGTPGAYFTEQQLGIVQFGTTTFTEFAYRPWRAGALSHDNNWTAEVDAKVPSSPLFSDAEIEVSIRMKTIRGPWE